jgi:hypothetical protein
MTVALPIYINFSSYGGKFSQNSKCHKLLWFATLTVAMQKTKASLLTNVQCAPLNTNLEKKYFYWGSVIAVLMSKTPETEHRHRKARHNRTLPQLYTFSKSIF